MKRLKSLVLPSIVALATGPVWAQATLQIHNSSTSEWTLVVLQAPPAQILKVGSEEELLDFREALPFAEAGADSGVALPPGKRLAIPAEKALLIDWSPDPKATGEATFQLEDSFNTPHDLTFRFTWGPEPAGQPLGLAETSLVLLRAKAATGAGAGPKAVCAFPDGELWLSCPSYQWLFRGSKVDPAAFFAPGSADDLAGQLEAFSLSGEAKSAGAESKGLVESKAASALADSATRSGLPVGPSPASADFQSYWAKALVARSAGAGAATAGGTPPYGWQMAADAEAGRTAADPGGGHGASPAGGTMKLPELSARTSEALSATTAGYAQALQATAAAAGAGAAADPFSRIQPRAMGAGDDGAASERKSRPARKRWRDSADDDPSDSEDGNPRKR